MDSDADIQKSDIVMSTAGRDQGEWFYVIDADRCLPAAGQRQRPQHRETRSGKSESICKKSYRSETRVAGKMPFAATKCSTANYEGTWPFLASSSCSAE